MTGESLPVEKISNTIETEELGIGDQKNIAFSSSLVTYGRGKGIVTSIGMNTEVGKIATIISNTEKDKTPLQEKLDGLGKVLGIGALAICLVIFIVGLLYGKEPLNMFMTAVSLAVAAIPEGLAAVSTIVLAIGVQKMVQENAIIKKLPAVETLGSSKVICSDKTGTLTQNKMKVIKINGDKNFILELASMCTDCNIKNDNSKLVAEGEATEVAIVNYGLKLGQNKDKLYRSDDVNKKVVDTISTIEKELNDITSVKELIS